MEIRNSISIAQIAEMTSVDCLDGNFQKWEGIPMRANIGCDCNNDTIWLRRSTKIIVENQIVDIEKQKKLKSHRVCYGKYA